ncbi:hypothetical protein [Candidatus Uabimicrobium sp. HlEnr_7]|uniref:hypothetical protein n=1 Tax=Candidatus Uabimicrobium helgolandensis TaxID=3095367 RepID=UPI0035563091
MIKWLFLLYIVGTFTFAEIITLKDGTVLHGVVLQYSEEDFILKTFDKKEFTIKWAFLHKINKQKLQKKLGLATDTPKISLTKGVVLYLRNGATLKGRLLSKGSSITVKTKNGDISVPRNNVLNIEKQKIEITDVYSINEIYSREQKKYNFDDADEQWKLANFLVAVGAVEQAKKHFERAQELSPDYAEKSKDLAGTFDKFSEEQAEQKAYRKYQLYLRAGRYGDARSALEELRAYKTKEEIDDYLKRISQSEQSYYKKSIAPLFFRRISSEITSLSLDRKSTLEVVKEKLLNETYSKIMKEIAEKYAVSETEVENFLQKRGKDNLERYNFGRGTFVVGLGRDTERVENFDKIQSFFKARRVAVSSQKISEEDWWKKESSSQKREWLHAFFYLNKLQIEKEQWKICPQCAAKGFVKSGRRNLLCPSCQGVKFERVVAVSKR